MVEVIAQNRNWYTVKLPSGDILKICGKKNLEILIAQFTIDVSDDIDAQLEADIAEIEAREGISPEVDEIFEDLKASMAKSDQAVRKLVDNAKEMGKISSQALNIAKDSLTREMLSQTDAQPIQIDPQTITVEAIAT